MHSSVNPNAGKLRQRTKTCFFSRTNSQRIAWGHQRTLNRGYHEQDRKKKKKKLSWLSESSFFTYDARPNQSSPSSSSLPSLLSTGITHTSDGLVFKVSATAWERGKKTPKNYRDKQDFSVVWAAHEKSEMILSYDPTGGAWTYWEFECLQSKFRNQIGEAGGYEASQKKRPSKFWPWPAI